MNRRGAPPPLSYARPCCACFPLPYALATWCRIRPFFWSTSQRRLLLHHARPMFPKVSEIIDGLKALTPQLLLSIAIFTAVVPFSPTWLTDMAGLTDLVKAYRPYLGAALLAAISVLIAHLPAVVARWWRAKRSAGARLRQLSQLTPEERGYLAPYILEQRNTQVFPMEDGIAGGLMSKGILYLGSRLVTLDGMAYNLQLWARQHLSANSHLLDGYVKFVSADDEYRI